MLGNGTALPWRAKPRIALGLLAFACASQVKYGSSPNGSSPDALVHAKGCEPLRKQPHCENSTRYCRSDRETTTAVTLLLALRPVLQSILL